MNDDSLSYRRNHLAIFLKNTRFFKLYFYLSTIFNQLFFFKQNNIDSIILKPNKINSIILNPNNINPNTLNSITFFFIHSPFLQRFKYKTGSTAIFYNTWSNLFLSHIREIV